MSKKTTFSPIEFSAMGRKYRLDVAKFDSLDVTNIGGGLWRTTLTMTCDRVEIKPDHSDFIEDVKALAAQYGLEIEEIKLKD